MESFLYDQHLQNFGAYSKTSTKMLQGNFKSKLIYPEDNFLLKRKIKTLIISSTELPS